MTRAAVLFPGQGNLAADLSSRLERTDPELHELVVRRAGAEVFDRAEESQRWRQPAQFAASMGCWRTIEPALASGELTGAPVEIVAFAGHSLGEITALTAAGALVVADAVELVCLRGELFAAVETDGPPAGMCAIVGDDALAFARSQAGQDLVVANDNSPQQVVIAGGRDAVLAARAAARGSGLRAVMLPLGIAAHTALMAEVVAPLAALLSGFDLAEPAAPVWSSTRAAPFSDTRDELAAGCTAPVRWRETVIGIRDAGAALMIDAGPGHVLAAQAAKTIGPDVEVLAPCDE